jgi:hypothetical protein
MEQGNLSDGKKTDQGIQKALRILYFVLIPVLFITLGLAWWQYPEPFDFVEEYISNLGAINSEEGYSNTTSLIIMVVGFSILAAISIAIAIIYFIRRDLRFNWLKGGLNIVLAFGAIFLAFPHDFSNRLIHGIGAVTFLLCFAVMNFTLQLLRFTRRHYKKPPIDKVDFTVDLTVVIITFVLVVFLGVLWIVDETIGITITAFIPQLWQKIVLIIDSVAIFCLDVNDM